VVIASLFLRTISSVPVFSVVTLAAVPAYSVIRQFSSKLVGRKLLFAETSPKMDSYLHVTPKFGS
jgi:hypothetical protein